MSTSTTIIVGLTDAMSAAELHLATAPARNVAAVLSLPPLERKEERRTLDSVDIRFESPNTSQSISLRRAIVLDFIQSDPPLAQIFKEHSWPDGVSPDDEYELPNACWMVAYDSKTNEPIAIAGAQVHGQDVWMGRGYVLPPWRGSGLIQEPGYLRWQWALQRGATRSIIGTRLAMRAAIKFLTRMGYHECAVTGKEPYFQAMAEVWMERPIAPGNFPEPTLTVSSN